MAAYNEVRLQKFMADCGVASRRGSEKLIEEGKVKVNGRKACIGDKIKVGRDTVTVSGKKISESEKKVTIMLNKPRGYITTVSDELDRQTVMQLVGDIKERIYPVGRLDKESQGLLIMTNDGELANFLMHPAHNVKKRYNVTVQGETEDDVLQQLRDGVVIDSKKAAPCQVEVISQKEDRTRLRFTLTEGKNREIREMCESVGLEVMRLKRVAIGGLKLGQLPVGSWRYLTESEIKALKAK